MASEIYLPNTHGSIPAVIKVGGLCYEYDSTVPRDEHQEDHCWNEVEKEFDECDDCCFPNYLYRECQASSSSAAPPAPGNDCNGCTTSGTPIPDNLTITFTGLSGDFAVYNGSHTLQWSSGCLWDNRNAGGTRISLDEVGAGGFWIAEISHNLLGDCLIGFTTFTSPCSPYGSSYSIGTCFDSLCSDTGSCGASSGATCSVS